MLAKLTNAAPQDDAEAKAELMAGLGACLALADELDLAMVAIHIEQARTWLIDHGADASPELTSLGAAASDVLN